MVLISGEPGIGKSRLTAALSQRIETEPHTRLRYFCSPHHQDSALHPFIVQLERAAEFRPGDTLSAGSMDRPHHRLRPGKPSRRQVRAREGGHALHSEQRRGAGLRLPLPRRVVAGVCPERRVSLVPARGLQVLSDQRRAAYDELPVRAATMIRGIACMSAAVTASASIALNSGVSGSATPRQLRQAAPVALQGPIVRPIARPGVRERAQALPRLAATRAFS